MNDLVLGQAYRLPAKGSGIYCGYNQRETAREFVLLDDISQRFFYAPDFNPTQIRKQPKRLRGLDLGAKGLLKAGDTMFFINDNGLFFGEIQSVEHDSCVFSCRNVTKGIHLSHLFTYEHIFGEVPTRTTFKPSLSCENNANKKQGLAGINTAESCCV
jgi:hypothetical protein